jgi:O-acetyl-ADP-ribose deacetylase (regulator of RNase III)
MKQLDWVVLSFAAVCLAVGVPLALAGRHRLGVPRPRMRLVVAWVFLALAPSLVVFWAFPDSTVTGDIAGVQAGGAIAAFLVVWLLGIRHSLQADDLEGREAKLLAGEVRAAAASTRGAEPAGGGDVEMYRLAKRPRRAIALVPGSMHHIDFADVWVNSENTNMQMARYYEHSISGMVRYLGGRHDDAGEVVEDIIGAALAEAMTKRRSVPIGTVFATTPGELAKRNNVAVLLHVAAVAGEFGQGYAPAKDIGACVRNVLRHAEQAAAERTGIRSVVLPLLGAGTGRGNLPAMVKAVLEAVLDHLQDDPRVRIGTVYVPVYTVAEQALCQEILRADSRLRAAEAVPRSHLRDKAAATA